MIQFDGPVPEYSVVPQGSSSFTEDASGRTVTLQGSSGVKIVVRSTSARSTAGVMTYNGSTDLQPSDSVLKEARQMGDFERTFSWGLGLAKPNCLRVLVLTGPDRLVVDISVP